MSSQLRSDIQAQPDDGQPALIVIRGHAVWAGSGHDDIGGQLGRDYFGVSSHGAQAPPGQHDIYVAAGEAGSSRQRAERTENA